MLEGVTIIFIVVMLGSTLIGVADRFVLGIGLSWTEELSRFLLVWASLLAAAVATKRRSHFRVAFVIERLSRAGKIGVNLACIGGLGVAILKAEAEARPIQRDADAAYAKTIEAEWIKRGKAITHPAIEPFQKAAESIYPQFYDKVGGKQIIDKIQKIGENM